MAIDIEAVAPVLSNAVGGLSGKYLHPIALRMVFELYVNLGKRAQIVGSGGVVDWKTAVEFLLAGASAVQIGSVLADSKLKVFRTVASGIVSYLSGNGFGSVSEIVGLATLGRRTERTKIEGSSKRSSKR
jgi:dihydroorotate dehydrogenase (NAD+) catalytic subunit